MQGGGGARNEGHTSVAYSPANRKQPDPAMRGEQIGRLMIKTHHTRKTEQATGEGLR